MLLTKNALVFVSTRKYGNIECATGYCTLYGMRWSAALYMCDLCLLFSDRSQKPIVYRGWHGVRPTLNLQAIPQRIIE